MRIITAGQLRARLGEALDAASAGERIVIERDHLPLAAIVPLEDVQHLEGATDEARRRKLAALEQLADLAQRMQSMAPTPDDDFPNSAAWIPLGPRPRARRLVRLLVVDRSSAVLAVLLGEEAGGRVRELLQTRSTLLVPWSFWLELVNALTRRHRWPASAVLEAVFHVERLGFETRGQDRVTLLAIIDQVEAHDLTAYDAAYLALAVEADADLLTADVDLATAAGDRAILVGPGRRARPAPGRSGRGLAEAPARYAAGRREPSWPAWPGAAAYVQVLRQQVVAELAAEGDATLGR